MKKIAGFLLLLLVINSAIAQDTVSVARHTGFFEFGGTGIGTSINYEYKYPISAMVSLSARVGYGYKDFGRANVTTVPVELTSIFGRQRGHIEVGMGYSPMLNYFGVDTLDNLVDLGTANVLIPRVGYRLQEPHGGFYFRASIAPMIFMSDWLMIVRGSVCLGYTITTKEHREFYRR